jgi:cysteine-rich repeat protein
MHTSNGLCNLKISALLLLFQSGCTLEVYNQSTEACGNGVIDVQAQIPETCDDGPNNGTLGDPCSATCQTVNSVTITGIADPNYLISGTQVTSAAHAVLKMVFEDRTPGTNVSLCAGIIDDFAQGKCSMWLSDSGGPGFQFLTIIDANALSGKVLYVIRQVGTVPAQFVLTIE